MKPPEGSPDWLEVVTAAERPGRWQQAMEEGLFDDVWPEYNTHGNHTPAYFGPLFPRYPEYQALFLDGRGERVIARGRTIPFRWDGTLDDLPPGIDALGLRAVAEAGTPTALSALAAEVDREYQGTGLSGLVIRAMAAIAAAHGLRRLVAPVRPNWKDRYPITPIGRYAGWSRPDGLPFDPWMRVHARLGGRILRAEPRSLHILAPVADWQTWTGMAFPADGQYVFPGGLAPLTVSGGEGDYWEPNVWMAHDAIPPGAAR
jgi:GNAT superfamily N-acetyltransferase